MADLKTDYVDDKLNASANQLRKYQQIKNDDGTVSFVDVTDYTATGTSFGANDINATNKAVNKNTADISSLNLKLDIVKKSIAVPETVSIVRNESYIENGIYHAHFQLALASTIMIGGAILDLGFRPSKQVVLNVALTGGANYIVYNDGTTTTWINGSSVVMPAGYYIVDGSFIIK